MFEGFECKILEQEKAQNPKKVEIYVLKHHNYSNMSD